MEELMPISNINDFLFCPASIYYHGLMDGADRTMVQSKYQINGTNAHKSVDSGTYSTRKDVLQGMSVLSERYGLIGRIDSFDIKKGILTERKKHINTVFPGYIFQMYGEYFGLIEEGYVVKELRLHSMDDNRNYIVPHPDESEGLVEEFENIIEQMHEFKVEKFHQSNVAKCLKCIYSPMCPSGFYHDD